MVGSLPALWRYVRCPPMKLHRPLAYRATASTKEAQAPALWRAIELLIFRIDKVEDAVRYDKVTPPHTIPPLLSRARVEIALRTDYTE